MTVAEACAYTKMGKQSVYRALHIGELKGHQSVAPRGTWRIHRDDLDDWLRGNQPYVPRPLPRVTGEPKRAYYRKRAGLD